MLFKIFGRVTAILSLLLAISFGLSACGGCSDQICDDRVVSLDPTPSGPTALAIRIGG